MCVHMWVERFRKKKLIIKQLILKVTMAFGLANSSDISKIFSIVCVHVTSKKLPTSYLVI